MTCKKCPESNRYNSRCKMYVSCMSFNSQAGAFQCFSLISAMLCGGVAGFYLFTIPKQQVMIKRREYGNQENRNHDAEIAIILMIFILGAIECCIGCGACVSIHRMTVCCLSSPAPQVSRIYYSPFRISATQ